MDEREYLERWAKKLVDFISLNIFSGFPMGIYEDEKFNQLYIFIFVHPIFLGIKHV